MTRDSLYTTQPIHLSPGEVTVRSDSSAVQFTELCGRPLYRTEPTSPTRNRCLTREATDSLRSPAPQGDWYVRPTRASSGRMRAPARSLGLPESMVRAVAPEAAAGPRRSPCGRSPGT